LKTFDLHLKNLLGDPNFEDVDSDSDSNENNKTGNPSTPATASAAIPLATIVTDSTKSLSHIPVLQVSDEEFCAEGGFNRNVQDKFKLVPTSNQRGLKSRLHRTIFDGDDDSFDGDNASSAEATIKSTTAIKKSGIRIKGAGNAVGKKSKAPAENACLYFKFSFEPVSYIHFPSSFTSL
jgi:hypothetical protein